MAQLPYVEPEQADPLTKAVYDKAQVRFQMVLNIFKITGNAPEIGAKMWEIFFDILQDGTVDWPTKELVILKTVKMGDCLYCVTQHEVVSERLGVTPEKQADLLGVAYRASPHFTDAERAVLDLCAQIVIDPEQIPADTWARVRQHYSDAQLVELVATIGAYMQVSKFGDAMGVELEPVFRGRTSLLFEREPVTSKSAAQHFAHLDYLTVQPTGTA